MRFKAQGGLNLSLRMENRPGKCALRGLVRFQNHEEYVETGLNLRDRTLESRRRKYAGGVQARSEEIAHL